MAELEKIIEEKVCRDCDFYAWTCTKDKLKCSKARSVLGLDNYSVSKEWCEGDEDECEGDEDEKEKILWAEIVVRGTEDKPYYEIMFQKVGEEEFTIGYGSYDLGFVREWLKNCFELVQVEEECKSKDYIEVDVDVILEDVIKGLDMDVKVEICSGCKFHGTCPQLHNSKCEIMVSKVKKILEEESELAKEAFKKEKVVQFPVDMDELQLCILKELMSGRLECMNDNVLSVHGMVAVIDALFYLVKSIPMKLVGGVDFGEPGGDFTPKMGEWGLTNGKGK